MKTTVSLYDFRQAFHDYGRGESFSYAGLEALFNHFEDLEESCGAEIELDVIAVCCDYSEARSAADWCKDSGYDLDYTDCLDDDDREELALEFLRDNTEVVEFDGGVIAAGF